MHGRIDRVREELPSFFEFSMQSIDCSDNIRMSVFWRREDYSSPYSKDITSIT